MYREPDATRAKKPKKKAGRLSGKIKRTLPGVLKKRGGGKAEGGHDEQIIFIILFFNNITRVKTRIHIISFSELRNGKKGFIDNYFFPF